MVRLIGLEWNDTEARVAVATRRGRRVALEHAFTVSLQPTEPGPEAPPVDVGQRLAAALAARRLGKADVLVAVGRTNVELRQLALPPAPDEELPDMVRFQAMREFNALGDDWPLDFLPIDDAPDQPRTVLAAAIAPDQVEQIRATCQGAGLRLRRLVLRPCAAASLLWRLQGEDPLRVRLLVDLLGDETDLTVVIDRKVIFLRTARLPSDPLTEAEGVQVLFSEIRRTMAAVQNQLGGRRVEAVVLCGTGDQHAALAATMEERLATPVELFDPFQGLELQGDVRKALPEHPGRFAPLLGMLLDELEGAAHGIDFLHPRRRPQPPSRQRTYAAGALAVLVPLVALLAYGLVQWNRLGAERVRLESDLKLWDAQLAQVTKDEKALKEIEAWKAGDVVWLDELDRISQKAPSAKEVILTQLEFLALRSGGEIRMEGVAGTVGAMKAMDEALRDATHRVVPKERGEASSAKPPYTLRFGTSIAIVSPPRPSAAVASRPAKRAAPVVSSVEGRP